MSGHFLIETTIPKAVESDSEDENDFTQKNVSKKTKAKEHRMEKDKKK